MNLEVCARCGGEIPDLSPTPDPTLPPAGDDYWWFTVDSQDRLFHWVCRPGVQLELQADRSPQ